MAYKTINDRMEQKPPYRVQDLNAVFKSIPIYSFVSQKPESLTWEKLVAPNMADIPIQARYIGE